MKDLHRRRRVVVLLLATLMPVAALVSFAFLRPVDEPQSAPISVIASDEPLAIQELEKLTVRERASRDGYARDEFGSGWAKWLTCNTRQKILNRDLHDINLDDDNCKVLSGVLDDPYTGNVINFTYGTTTSSAVQIDHVVALSNAWQTGARDWEKSKRVQLANDDLELLAVDGPANMKKSDSDAADWLPPNRDFRCQYVARQIAVKIKYELWVIQAEHDAMAKVLETCPNQQMPSP
jgi:hypothetical protein